MTALLALLAVPCHAEPVRFVALGDAGTGTEAQHAVGELIAATCARPDRGCDFVLYLGDNFYDAGVNSAYDPLFDSHFEQPYAPVDLRFFAVLGNHDVKGDYAVDVNWDKGAHQVAYTALGDKFTMPAFYYAVPDGLVPGSDVDLWGLHTTEIFFADWVETKQGSWLDDQLAASSARWKIAFGHHPYISNGQHGDAGSYEQTVDGMCQVPGVAVACGHPLKDFFEQHVCGEIDLYLAGHDHNRQWLGETCGTHFVVSGAGAKVRGPRNDANRPVYADFEQPGFLWVQIDDGTLEAWFHGLPKTPGEAASEDGPFLVIK